LEVVEVKRKELKADKRGRFVGAIGAIVVAAGQE
jgi:hypothetical protein